MSHGLEVAMVDKLQKIRLLWLRCVLSFLVVVARGVLSRGCRRDVCQGQKITGQNNTVHSPGIGQACQFFKPRLRMYRPPKPATGHLGLRKESCSDVSSPAWNAFHGLLDVGGTPFVRTDSLGHHLFCERTDTLNVTPTQLRLDIQS